MSIVIKVTNKEGNVISGQTLEPKEIKPPQETKVTVKHSWYFEERPGDGLLWLCNKYIQKI